MRPASFFDYDPSIRGWRFIRLTEEEPTLDTGERHQDEEGWSSTSTRWALDGDRVVCTTYRGHRDCDGHSSSTCVVACPVSDLAAREVYGDGDAEASVSGPYPFRVPAWDEEHFAQRDHAAEAAGY